MEALVKKRRKTKAIRGGGAMQQSSKKVHVTDEELEATGSFSSFTLNQLAGEVRLLYWFVMCQVSYMLPRYIIYPSVCFVLHRLVTAKLPIAWAFSRGEHISLGIKLAHLQAQGDELLHRA